VVLGVRFNFLALTIIARAFSTFPPRPSPFQCCASSAVDGFGQSRYGALRRYRVVHPEWDVYPAARATLNVDFGAVYGEPWAIPTDRTPYSVVFAVGSEVAVYPHANLPA
jgi:hypothetical protein